MARSGFSTVRRPRWSCKSPRARARRALGTGRGRAGRPCRTSESARGTSSPSPPEPGRRRTARRTTRSGTRPRPRRRARVEPRLTLTVEPSQRRHHWATSSGSGQVRRRVREALAQRERPAAEPAPCAPRSRARDSFDQLEPGIEQELDVVRQGEHAGRASRRTMLPSRTARRGAPRSTSSLHAITCDTERFFVSISNLHSVFVSG